MLVLARKENEIIKIGNDIEIMIVNIKANVVRLGIKAPRSVQIDRQEVYQQKKAKAE